MSLITKKMVWFSSYPTVELLLVATAAAAAWAAAWAACQNGCPGGVDGDHDLAAQSLVLDAHAVGVDHAEGRQLRKAEKEQGSPVTDSVQGQLNPVLMKSVRRN